METFSNLFLNANLLLKFYFENLLYIRCYMAISSSWLVWIGQLPFLLSCMLLSVNSFSWRLENIIKVKVEDLVDKICFVWKTSVNIRIFCRDSLHLHSKKQQKHNKTCLYCDFKTTALFVLLLAQQHQSSMQLMIEVWTS